MQRLLERHGFRVPLDSAVTLLDRRMQFRPPPKPDGCGVKDEGFRHATDDLPAEAATRVLESECPGPPLPDTNNLFLRDRKGVRLRQTTIRSKTEEKSTERDRPVKEPSQRR